MKFHLNVEYNKNRDRQTINANLEQADFHLKLREGMDIYLFGDVFYYIKDDGNIKLVNSNSRSYLKKIFSEYKLADIMARLEGQYIILYIDSLKHLVRVCSDRYARLDCFYAQNKHTVYLSSDLDAIFKHLSPKYDQKMLAHLFSVYGWYVPKGLTIYKNVRRLRIGEIIELSKNNFNSRIIKYKPLEIEDYADSKLETYYKILKESVIARANPSGKTWVSASSGWDSSMLAGLLADEFGSKNVRMLTGSMRYSDRTTALNNFEVNRVKKIGKYYGIKPIVVDFYLNAGRVRDYWQRVLPLYKSKHLYAVVAGYSHNRLSDYLKQFGGREKFVFNGETSDSFHNFGFSQFTTFFHNKNSFKEYADKMNCYLYGPSFLNKVLNGTYERDKVFQLLKKTADMVKFSSRCGSREETIQGYLFPFIYGPMRVPFIRVKQGSLLTQRGMRELYHFPFREYLPQILSGLNERNIYAWLIYLYQHFHCQGSTVNATKYSMEFNNHKWRMPFNDYRLIDFLCQVPERWGRGLELNNTKFPLKWVARNKIKFPYELIDQGPHSYLYDVLEGFSIAAEVVYSSGATNFFRDTLRTRPYKDLLSDKYFDMHYLDRLVADFLNGKQAQGIDFNNLLSLVTLCITGWY